MIISLFQRKSSNDISQSLLFNENTFYKAFLKDLYSCKKELIIESPFVTASRMQLLLPYFKELLQKNIKIHLITRDLVEHDEEARHESTNEILECKEIGIDITLVKGRHHRKLAIIDSHILWEGSLNILSHGKSKEIMRRIESKDEVSRMLRFLNYTN